VKRVALDLAWALLVAIASTAILVHAGGIWDAVTSGDLHALMIPKFEYAARRLFGEGRLALWDPYDFCGIPILGTSQGQVLYLPTLIAFALWSPWTALQTLFAFHVLVLSLGMTAYLRRHDVGRPAAAVATVIALAGVLTTSDFVGIDHPTFLAGVAWMPTLLHFAGRAVDGDRAIGIAGMAIAWAMQWLSGYPDFALTSCLLVVAIAVVTGSAPLHVRLATLAGGFGLGAAVAALQILPLLETIDEGVRAGLRWQFALWRGRSGVHSVSDVVTQLSVRQGAAPLALAGWALAWSHPRRQRMAWAGALVWCVLALNEPFDLLYSLPGFDGVRFGYAWSALAGVFLGLLAADGLARLERGDRAWVPWLGRMLAVVVVVVGARIIDAAPTLDFPTVGLRFTAPDLSIVTERAPVLRHWLDGAPGSRLVAERELAAGSGLRDRLPMPFGHEPAIPPRRVMQLLEEAGLLSPLGRYGGERWVGAAARPELLALLGARFIVVPRGAEGPFLALGFARRADLPPNDVLLEGAAIPRARLVHRLAVAEAPTDDATLAALFEHAGEAAELAVVDRLPATGPRPTPGGEAADRVAIVEDSPDRVVIDATAGSPALLVLTDTYFPGWVAEVDGMPAEIVRADHAFRGVLLDVGPHRVVFRYTPASVRVGGLLSAAGLLIVLALAVRR
jgi:hypothetical protein